MLRVFFRFADDLRVHPFDSSPYLSAESFPGGNEDTTRDLYLHICSSCNKQKCHFCLTHKIMVCQQCSNIIHSQCSIKPVSDMVKTISASDFDNSYSAWQHVRADLIQVKIELNKNRIQLIKSKEDSDAKIERSYKSACEKLRTDHGKLLWDNQELFDKQIKKLQDNIDKVHSVSIDLENLLSHVKINMHKPMDERFFEQMQEKVEQITVKKKGVQVLQNGLQISKLDSNIYTNYQPLKPTSRFGSVLERLDKKVRTEKIPDITFPMNRSGVTKRKCKHDKDDEQSATHMMIEKDSLFNLSTTNRKPTNQQDSLLMVHVSAPSASGKNNEQEMCCESSAATSGLGTVEMHKENGSMQENTLILAEIGSKPMAATNGLQNVEMREENYRMQENTSIVASSESMAATIGLQNVEIRQENDYVQENMPILAGSKSMAAISGLQIVEKREENERMQENTAIVAGSESVATTSGLHTVEMREENDRMQENTPIRAGGESMAATSGLQIIEMHEENDRMQENTAVIAEMETTNLNSNRECLTAGSNILNLNEEATLNEQNLDDNSDGRNDDSDNSLDSDPGTWLIAITLVGSQSIKLEDDKPTCCICSVDTFPDGRIIMCDESNDKVKMLTPNGKLKQLPLYYIPEVIATYGTKTAFVFYESRIFRIDTSGENILIEGSTAALDYGEDEDEQVHIKQMAVVKDKLVVCLEKRPDSDSEAAVEVRKITTSFDLPFEGRLMTGKQGQKLFEQPFAAATDKDDHLIIADAGRNRIYIINLVESDNLIESDVLKSGRLEDYVPFKSVTSDNCGYIYACSWNELFVFDQNLHQSHALKHTDKPFVAVKYDKHRDQLILAYKKCNEIEFYQLHNR